MKRIITFALILSVVVIALAQQHRTIVYGERDGLSHRHVTQILQDKDGFIWLSTWNGIDRFDGREFVTFKSRPGDGVGMPSDRFRKIAIDDHDDNILNCRVDDSWFRFSLLTGRFSPVSAKKSKVLKAHPGHGNGKSVKGDSILRFSLTDRQGLLWNVLSDGISVSLPNTTPLEITRWDNASEVKSLFLDDSGRLWVATKDGKVRVYEHGIVSYLTAGGSLSPVPAAFPSPVYCIYNDKDTDEIFLGCKPGGLYRLRHNGYGYVVTHVDAPESFKMNEVYDIVSDSHGRLWVATMDNGLVCIDHGHYSAIHFGRENKVRRITLADDNTLAAATTEGLLTVDITPGHGNKWHLHQRQPSRVNSLSTNACMDIAGTDGRWYIATESGGINMTSDKLNAPSLTFRHYDSGTGLGSDVILSATSFPSQSGPSLLAVTDNTLIILDQRTGESREFTDAFFGQQLSFSDAKPVYDSASGTWYIGLNDGFVTIEGSMLCADKQLFPIVLTSLKIENNPTEYMVNGLNEIKLSPDDRTVDISFAVLDYRNATNIRYAYRVRGDADWHYLGNDNNVRLAELSPGEYLLDLRATNAMGTWNPKIRTVKIIVEPMFTETVWFRLIIILIISGILLGVFLTVRLIRRMKAKQKETLEAYLSLLEESKKKPEQPVAPSPALSEEDEAIMNRIMTFVEAHISDSDVSVDDMAEAAAMSRSSLNRKMKSLVGLPPADFLREARIKRAQELLIESRTPVAETAYRCGFTDPKYFSRVFRQSVGMSPSEYKANKGH